jgi:hypothetical protein
MRCRYSTVLLPVSAADIAIDLGVCFRPLPCKPIDPGPAALQERGDSQLGVEPIQLAPNRCGKFKVIAAAYDDFHGASVSARHSSARQSSRGAVVPWSRAGSFRRRSLFGAALVGAPSAMTVRFWSPRKVRRRVLTRRRPSLLRGLTQTGRDRDPFGAILDYARRFFRLGKDVHSRANISDQKWPVRFAKN